MTPNYAYHEMRDIVRKHKADPDKARRHGVELLCKIARMTGYYRSAEVFEEMGQPKSS